MSKVIYLYRTNSILVRLLYHFGSKTSFLLDNSYTHEFYWFSHESTEAKTKVYKYVSQKQRKWDTKAKQRERMDWLTSLKKRELEMEQLQQ